MPGRARPRLFGTIPPGWSRDAWINHLAHLAETAEARGRKGRARLYREWMEVLRCEEDGD